MDPAAGVGVLAALAAGLVSFLSPCVLPLVPGYLSAVVGVSPAELDRAPARRVLVPSLLFVLSFSAIFIALGASATTVGAGFRAHRDALEKVAAVLIVLMGAFFLLTPFVKRLNREWHVGALVQRAGKGGPIVAGAAFAVAWTPCVGPTLGAILAAASLSQSAGRGALLLGIYASGLAIPFLATALTVRRMIGAFAVVKRHYGSVIAVGGAILIVMGVLIWTGQLFQLNIATQRWLDDLGINFFNEV